MRPSQSIYAIALVGEGARFKCWDSASQKDEQIKVYERNRLNLVNHWCRMLDRTLWLTGDALHTEETCYLMLGLEYSTADASKHRNIRRNGEVTF